MFVRLLIVAALAVLLWAAFARPSGGAGPARTHVVRPGETLWSIAASHYAGDPREAVWRLQRRNSLREPSLFPGQRLLLPP